VVKEVPVAVSRGTLRLLLVGLPVAGLLMASWLGADDPWLGGHRDQVLAALHVLAPGLAAVLCLVPARRSTDRSDRAGWLFLGLAAATWSTASVTFAWYQLHVGAPPYPSVADLLYIGYAVPALVGLAMFSWSVPHAVSRAHTIVDGLVVAAGMLVVTWHLLLADLLTAPGRHDLVWWTTVVYLVVDTTVAAVVLSLAWRLVRARLSLGLVGAGLLLVAVCDVFYVRAGMTGTLVVGEQSWQAGYTLGFLLVALAAVTFVSTRRDHDAGVEPVDSPRGRWAGLAGQMVVYAVLTAAVVVTALAPPPWIRTPALLVLSLVTVLLALLREVLVALDAANLRAHLEDKVSERTRELDASRARLAAVTRTATDAIVVIDDHGRVRAWNAGAETLFGCDDEDALGQEMASFLPIRFREAHRDGVRRRRENGDGDVRLAIEVAALHTDGHEVPVELTVSSWSHEGERFYTGILRDITARREAEALRDRERGHMRLLQLVAVAANQAHDTDDAVATTVRLVASTLGWPVGHAMLVDGSAAFGAPLRTVAWHHTDPRYRELVEASERAALTTSSGVAAMTLHSGSPVWARTDDPRLHPDRAAAAQRLGLPSVTAFPIRAGEQLVGVLEFFAEAETEPEPAVIHLLDLVGTQLGRAVERDQAQRRLARLALQDALTGLANRVVFHERLELYLAQAVRERRNVGVVLIDLDGFKEVNDTLGHEAGDRLLVEVAERLRTSARASDTVARLGGDEFAIALSNVAGSGDVSGQVARLLDALAEPFELAGHVLRPRGSVGVALTEHGETAEVLLRNADLAMYDAKAAGKGRASFFHPDMHARMVERLDLAALLDRALADDELHVHYRPIVSLRTGRVVAQQALARWWHPERGLSDPMDVLGVTDNLELLERVTGTLLDRACTDAAAWHAAGEHVVRLSVSLPAGCLTPGVVTTLRDALERTGLPPGAVQLEVSEESLTRSSPGLEAGLAALAGLDVGIAVEGLGTGEVTLERFRDLRVRELKIGAHLVRGLPSDPTAAALVDAVLTTGLALEVGVTAAGVATSAQLGFLRARGCHAVKGPLTGDPAAYADRVSGEVPAAVPSGSTERGFGA
jgi:diguanylate cyclase (GGDEF)-like protein/PAS domain S-box-containing protein